MINSRTYKLTLVALMTALLSVSAYIRIPTPLTPVTLQCEMVILGALLWGRKVSLCATILYVAMGLLGLPVFSGGGGIHYVLTPTFGYLLGFILCSFFINTTEKPYFKAYTGLGIIYAAGIIYLYILTNYILHTPIGITPILIANAITLPMDVVLIALTVKTMIKIKSN